MEVLFPLNGTSVGVRSADTALLSLFIKKSSYWSFPLYAGIDDGGRVVTFLKEILYIYWKGPFKWHNVYIRYTRDRKWNLCEAPNAEYITITS